MFLTLHNKTIMSEGFIRYVIGAVMMVVVYGIMTFIMGMPFEPEVIALVVILYLGYTYFRHGRKK